MLLGFLALVALNLLVNGMVIFRIVTRIETGVARLRRDLLAGLRRLDYPSYERLGHDAIYFNLATNVRRISEATALLGKLLLNIVGTLGCLIMLATLSPAAVAFVLVVMLAVGFVYVINQVHIGQAQQNAAAQERRFFSGMEGIVHGFKELKLHEGKCRDFFSWEIEQSSLAAEQARTSAGIRFLFNYALFALLLLLCVGVLLYLLPLLIPQFSEVAVKAAILAGIVPIAVLRDLPVIARARLALDELTKLQTRLQESVGEPAPRAQQPVALSRLELKDVTYRYTDAVGATLFQVGPLSTTFRAGTLNFIVGGNGSGKSTLVKLMTGLYPPRSGRILAAGRELSGAELRGLVTPVFADPHLFDRLYGYAQTPPELIQRWLADLDLERKTDYAQGRFTHPRLSTGQRKRLALIAALIEERPLLILDEWAAEQDPEHRDWYYREFLPTLKAQGRIVVVISHDDHYFGLADQLLVLDNGHIKG
ncbi:ATP-binding cassette domain-containing protein [Thiorhodovibrio litoralis]|uniref:ATP-binding cassette domain-containing protein n=1 Tax=Thiorhodovibrio litoralis TaxID=2952932 RepID=UPI002B256BDF|nr:ATP-binding cassette domain-containing protein [Thiorhodovibrio litoralis]